MTKQISDNALWGKVVQSSYGLQSKVVKIGDDSFEIFSSNNSSFSSAPYLTDGGLYDDIVESPASLEHLFSTEKIDYILVKQRQKLSSGFSNIIIEHGFVSFELDINQTEESLWKSLNQKTRNQVRKGQKQGFNLKIGAQELLDDFYLVISRCWRDLGSPTHSKLFYANILAAFSKSRLFVIYSDNKPIAAAIVIWNSTTIFHPFAGSLKKYNATSVNNMLYWEIIRFGIQNQLKIFDMGRSHKQQGTYRYKASWGAKPIQLYYHYFLASNAKMPKPHDHFFYKLATSCWRYVPLPIANLLGPTLIYSVL